MLSSFLSLESDLISQFILDPLFGIQDQMGKLFHSGIVHPVFRCRYANGIRGFSVKTFQ